VLTLLKTLAIIAVMVLIVPASVWAGTGSLSHARWALRRYLLAMSLMVLPGAILAGLVLISQLI